MGEGNYRFTVPLHATAIKFNDHPEWNFSVPLKKQLINEPSLWEEPEKMFVLSDIEGEFAAFRELLINNHIIDSQYNWLFGKGHLIICGDLFDRGKHVTEFLLLLYALEDKAKAKGGYVHIILGNHDIMNLSGDLRYVDAKYFEEAKKNNSDYRDWYSINSELGR